MLLAGDAQHSCVGINQTPQLIFDSSFSAQVGISENTWLLLTQPSLGSAWKKTRKKKKNQSHYLKVDQIAERFLTLSRSSSPALPACCMRRAFSGNHRLQLLRTAHNACVGRWVLLSAVLSTGRGESAHIICVSGKDSTCIYTYPAPELLEPLRNLYVFFSPCPQRGIILQRLQKLFGRRD